jgi:hypothetical protein
MAKGEGEGEAEKVLKTLHERLSLVKLQSKDLDDKKGSCSEFYQVFVPRGESI